MERLQKFLAAAGLGSRRSCEEMIRQGRIWVDGEVVTHPGTKIDPQKQEVRCDGEIVKPARKVYYAFYKPRHVLCTNAPGSCERVIDYFRAHSHRLFTVGRLDKDSEGLLLVTNDGEFAQRVAHPRYTLPKVYLVSLRDFIAPQAISRIKKGVWLSIGKVAPDQLRLLPPGPHGACLELTMVEGKNREIRRIFAKVGVAVHRICRIRIGNITLNNLQPGKYRPLTRQEIADLMTLTSDTVDQATYQRLTAASATDKLVLQHFLYKGKKHSGSAARGRPRRTAGESAAARHRARPNTRRSSSPGHARSGPATQRPSFQRGRAKPRLSPPAVKKRSRRSSSQAPTRYRRKPGKR